MYDDDIDTSVNSVIDPPDDDDEDAGLTSFEDAEDYDLDPEESEEGGDEGDDE